MVQQIEITLQARKRGFHLVTDEIVRQLLALPAVGLVHPFWDKIKQVGNSAK